MKNKKNNSKEEGGESGIKKKYLYGIITGIVAIAIIAGFMMVGYSPSENLGDAGTGEFASLAPGASCSLDSQCSNGYVCENRKCRNCQFETTRACCDKDNTKETGDIKQDTSIYTPSYTLFKKQPSMDSCSQSNNVWVLSEQYCYNKGKNKGIKPAVCPNGCVTNKNKMGACVKCTPKTCSSNEYAGKCGSLTNGCGGNINCNCLTGQTCTNGVCIVSCDETDAEICAGAKTEFGAECGIVKYYDDCGNIRTPDCGTCQPLEWCTGPLGLPRNRCIIIENFDGTAINTALWTTKITGSPVTPGYPACDNTRIIISNGELLHDLIMNNCWLTNTLNQKLSGDFDVQIDFRTDYVPGNYWGSGINFYETPINSITFKYGYGNLIDPKGGRLFLLDDNKGRGNEYKTFSTEDVKGRMRLTRTGNVYTAYKKNSTDPNWVNIGSINGVTSDMTLEISSSTSLSGDPKAKIYYDNLIIY